jgi:hypothetical protein
MLVLVLMMPASAAATAASRRRGSTTVGVRRTRPRSMSTAAATSCVGTRHTTVGRRTTVIRHPAVTATKQQRANFTSQYANLTCPCDVMINIISDARYCNRKIRSPLTEKFSVGSDQVRLGPSGQIGWRSFGDRVADVRHRRLRLNTIGPGRNIARRAAKQLRRVGTA